MIKIPDFVYPKDDQGNDLCPRCKKVVSACDCPSLEKPKPKPIKVSPKVNLDKSNRHGKCVTLIQSLPRNETYLKDLAKKLKIKTGSGGTFYIDNDGYGVVEIQGDHKIVIEKFFTN
jgi:translation initiation factor 1